MCDTFFGTKADAAKIVDRIEYLIAHEDYTDLFWDNAVIDIHKSLDIQVVGVDCLHEIDTEVELRVLEKYLNSK